MLLDYGATAARRLISITKANRGEQKIYQIDLGRLDRLTGPTIDCSDIRAPRDEFFEKAAVAWPPAKRADTCSRAKLAMRAKAHGFESIVIGLAVDENEIRPDVAVAVIAPFAGQWLIMSRRRKDTNNGLFNRAPQEAR
jgi:hypothetical protein